MVDRPGAGAGTAAHGPEEALVAMLAGSGPSAVFQPIVEIETGAVVAFEALARGPAGGPLERPDAMFATAHATGRLAELDWACRGAAFRAALAARLPRGRALFVNVEPSALGTPCPPHLEDVLARASQELDVVIEITERALTAAPADLLHLVGRVRARGWRVALDDVGADVRSLALMPLVRPDVIKLDLRLVQGHPNADVAGIVSAVSAERERSGAVIVAEGIETEEHVATARALGATLAQGWHFGRPAGLPRHSAEPARQRIVLPQRPAATTVPGSGVVSPFAVVQAARPDLVRRGDKRLLLALSHSLEHHAVALGESSVVVSAFQHADRFTPFTRTRYSRLGAHAAFVAALGVGMAPEPAPGVRGAHLHADDPLLGEWSVVVLGPHFSGALVAVDLGDDGEDAERRFDFAVTYDRALVTRAASALMQRVEPVAP